MSEDLTPHMREMLRLAYRHGFYAGRANAGQNLTPAQLDECASKYVALEPIPAVDAVLRARTVHS